MLRNYKMFTYEYMYITSAHVRDSMGEITGQMCEKSVHATVQVIAPSLQLADAWVEGRFNGPWVKHGWEKTLISARECPYILYELPH